MKAPAIKQKNEIDWYISRKPIEKYLNLERNDKFIISKFVNIKSEKASRREDQ
jgi:hypothetical protein